MNSKEKRKEINQILLTNTAKENIETLIKYIPEIEKIKGFEHKHPHHHLDVLGHTLLVLDNLSSENDLEIKMAGLLHDIGKPFSYQDGEVRHFHGHPEISAKITDKILTQLGYEANFVKNVNYLVKMHDTIIEPNNLDNTYQMTVKRLKLQYADAKAHAPSKVEKRVELLYEIKMKLEKTREER